MNAEVSGSEKSSADAALVEDLKLRLQGAQTQETAARAEVRRLAGELAIARRLLRFFVDAPVPRRGRYRFARAMAPSVARTART